MWNYPIWSAGFAWIPRKKLKGKVGKKKNRSHTQDRSFKEYWFFSNKWIHLRSYGSTLFPIQRSTFYLCIFISTILYKWRDVKKTSYFPNRCSSQSITNQSRNEEKHFYMKPMNNWLIILIQDHKSITFPHTTRYHILIICKQVTYQIHKKKKAAYRTFLGRFLSCQDLDL